MSKVLYGATDREKDIHTITAEPYEGLLLDAYYDNENWKKEVEEKIKEHLAENEGYCYSDSEGTIHDEYFPSSSSDDYLELNVKAGLSDLGFNEKIWQSVMVAFDNEQGFPAKNLCLISTEGLHDESLQRVDLLYLRTDGRIIPAELKISNNGKDAHGQIIRYMAGFAEKEFNKESVLSEAKKKVPSNIETIKDFFKDNNINNKKLQVIKTSGILICEEFHDDTLRAIRYLNEVTNMDIKMFDIDVFVKKGWKKEDVRFIYRVELNEIV